MTAPEQAVKEPFEYILQTRGKEIRSKLIDAFNYWIKVPSEKVVIIKSIIAKLHNASLLIDDIEDNSVLRRGQPCAHLIYGIPQTINSANYIYFEALHDILQFQNPRANEVFMKELLTLHIGQGMDIYWRDNVICPTEEQYLSMVEKKTGGLFRLSVGIMQALVNDTKDYTPLVNTLADLFQILDDYLNLQSNKYHTNKSFCEDFTEGKFSFPIIHSINVAKNRKVFNILKQKTKEETLKKYAVGLMKEDKSFEYTIQFLKKLKKRCDDLIAELGGNVYLQKIIDALMEQIETDDVDFKKV